MSTRFVWPGIIALAAALFAGCGGDGDTTPSDVNIGAAAGTINVTDGSAAGFALVLDGSSIPVAVRSDGTFEIANVPAGSHVLQAVGPDGMTGGSVDFTVTAGDRMVLPPITTTVGGKIVGQVWKLDNGALSPLAGVEVVARGDLVVIMKGDATTVGYADSRESSPLIYPPPAGTGETYKAHTDQEGYYVMKAVKPGSYFVTVAVPGLSAGETFTWVEAARTATADFTLEPVIEPGIGKVAGTVFSVNADGSKAPIMGALVQIYLSSGWQRESPSPTPLSMPAEMAAASSDPASDQGGVSAGSSGGSTGVSIQPPDMIWQQFSTLTDRNGKYSLNVPSGYADVSVWIWGYGQESRRIAIQPGETTAADFELSEQIMPIPMPAQAE